MNWRITTLTVFFSLLFGVLFFNLYSLQFEKRDYYLNKIEAQQEASGIFGAKRGNIYFTDKNGNQIQAALNKYFPMVYAVPKEIKNPVLAASTLSAVVGKGEMELEKILSKPNDQYELLVPRALPAQTEEIKKLGIAGIYVKDRELRFYQYGEMASHLLGFVSMGETLAGKYGLEFYFNEMLSGKSGNISAAGVSKPENGQNLFLTIDRNIQSEGEEILKNLIDEHNAEGGTIIVQEPKTGKILAMGSFPSFDPNSYSESEIGNFINPAVQAVYEPGSVFKLITMSAGIDSGKITPETSYFDSGSVTLNGKTVKNWDLKAHGELTMTEVIEGSINTGTIFAQRKMGEDIFYNYLVKFGFSEPTGISLPGEVSGKINNLKKGKDIDFATASYGQGIAVTPLEMINSVSAIANGGTLMKPFVLADEEPEAVRKVISEETASKIAKMMVSAVDKNVLAGVANYSVAGKTGTAFIPDFNKGGYTDDVINTYVGFAPACAKAAAGEAVCDPRFVILIKLIKPEGSPLAGQTVVPAFREMTQFILNYYGIAPDRLGQ
jgi:cell division protein FtsI/penicillin-binding protein 2